MKVLLAISDKLFGDAIVRFAASHNWPADTEFKFVSIMAPINLQPGKSIEEKKAFFDQEKTHVDKLLSQEKTAFLKEQPGAHATCEVLIGHTAKEILDCAQNWPASMIVMGSHGRQGLERAFLGSVSFYVASHAPCSFSIVRVSQCDMLDFDLDESDIPEEMKTGAEV
ncbi:MAG: universal stress protein [Candidatus Melainabacteria bacterium]|nr:universal stress protein [Candidatus Melainabacteria bacterium]